VNGRSYQRSRTGNPRISITPPLVISQTSLDIISVWNLWMRSHDGKKWSHKLCTLSITAGSKPGNKPRASSIAPTTVAIRTSAIGTHHTALL
jgi:hypothetical protein